MIAPRLFPTLAAALLVFAAAAPARAHDGLLRSVPTKDAHLATSPTALRLTFNRAPTLALVRIALAGPSGARVELEPFRIDSVTTVVAGIPGALDAGVYEVTWQITGADGHPVRGQFRFTIAPAATGAAVDHAGHTGVPAPDSVAPHHDPVAMPSGASGVQSLPYTVVRWAGLVALVLLLGAVAFRLGVLRDVAPATPGWTDDMDRSVTRLAALAGITFLALTVGRLIAQSVALHGGGEAFDLALVRGVLTGTTWGRAWIAQVVATILLLVLLARPPLGRRWLVAAAACVVIAVAQAMSGHAAAAGVPAVAADALHVLAAAGWIGGLAALVLVGVPGALRLDGDQRFRTVARLVNDVSPLALASAAILALTGAFGAWVHLGGLRALVGSDYGTALLWKLGVLSAVAATGAYNWLRVRPAVHQPVGTARLRRFAAIELTIAVAVIAITAVLVATPPPLMPGSGAAPQVTQ